MIMYWSLFNETVLYCILSNGLLGCGIPYKPAERIGYSGNRVKATKHNNHFIRFLGLR